MKSLARIKCNSCEKMVLNCHCQHPSPEPPVKFHDKLRSTWAVLKSPFEYYYRGFLIASDVYEKGIVEDEIDKMLSYNTSTEVH